MRTTKHSDLPLKGDVSSRFLPWLVALMVYLSAVGLAVSFVLAGLVERWDRDASGTLTVQVAPVPGASGEALTDDRVRQVVALMQKTPGVTRAAALGKEQTLSLLEPWLGSVELIKDLPLPRLIDVSMDPEARVDLKALSQTLSQTIPGASLDDHRVWLSRLIDLSVTTQWLSIGIVVLIGVITSVTVIYATRSSMAVHSGVIEVLHLIGAHDDYIAGQFARRAFTLGFAGGLVGLGMAVPTLVGIGWLAKRAEGGFLPQLTVPLTGVLVIATLPLVAALLARYTARLTVHGVLARAP